MLEKLLEKLGLSDKEARVYLATLELGQDSVQNIAKKAKVVRPTTYVVLEKLLKLGLVSTVTEGKKTKFIAENPKELANLLEEQKRDIDESKKELDENLSQFLAIYNSSGEKPAVRYFEGKEGLETLERYGLEKTLKSKEMISVAPVDILEEKFPETRAESVKKRAGSGIKSKLIYTDHRGPKPEVTNKKELREAVFVSNNELPINMTIAVYQWGVKMFYLGEKPYGVLIEDSEIARNMKEIFNLAWIGAKTKSKK